MVSIIVPVYNVEQYLSRCIESLINQTYENIEIILINDGSTDSSGVICDEYANMDSRIRVIHQENGGLSSARNTGINLAKGNYLSFLDSDDWVEEQFVEKMYNLIKQSQAEIAVCNFMKAYDEKQKIEVSEREILEFTNIEALEQLTGERYLQMVVAWGKLYKKKLFEKIEYPIGKIHEDEFTTYKLLYQANKVVLTTEKLLYYRQREDSITGSGFNINHRLHAIEAYQERASFFESIDQPKLVAKTYRVLFGIYISVNENLNMFKDREVELEFIKEFNMFRRKLQNSTQSILFKIYYELYYKAPQVGNFLNKIRLVSKK